jgi:CHAT domain-containing protein
MENPLMQITESPLSDEIASKLVDWLKAEADRHWQIDANRSLELADMIIQIGTARQDAGQIALGKMARGDALKFLGKFDEAWEILGEAGTLFLSADDEVGWARTRIGRLYLCVNVKRVEEALHDSEIAQQILERHNEQERILRLFLNRAVVYSLLGDFLRALDLYKEALVMAEALGEAGQGYLGTLFINLGVAYRNLGDFQQATYYYERGQAIFRERQESHSALVAALNIADLVQEQGNYRQALKLFHYVRETAGDQFPLEAFHAAMEIMHCYFLLNRDEEAYQIGKQVTAQYQQYGAHYYMARCMHHLALLEARFADYEAAYTALDTAQAALTNLNALNRLAEIRLHRGEIALKQGDLAKADEEAQAAARCFKENNQRVNYALSLLLQGQVRLAEGSDLTKARAAAQETLQTAQRNNLQALRYSAHVLLGKIGEVEKKIAQAQRHYYAAVATLERVQRHLTLALRPNFLEDKSEAFHSLLRLQLSTGQVERAFETLERTKSQIFLNYITHRDALRWSSKDNNALTEELNTLRREHQWFYQLAHNVEANAGYVTHEQALQEVAQREKRIRAVVEQLHLAGEQDTPYTPLPALETLQRNIPAGAALIEFYNDGSWVWAFCLTSTSIEVRLLPLSVAQIDDLLAKYQFNLACALQAPAGSALVTSLMHLSRQISMRLYQGLLGPLEDRIKECHRLIITPYGALHYLPFNTLYTGTQYLIERVELVVVPTATVLANSTPRRASGALSLAYTWEGKLPHTLREAALVQQLFGGARHDEAERDHLNKPPQQILHIAAHGKHRIDQPDLSYIQLADGQLYTDDLLQHDLSYELVTLSACETGRANVAAGDELIGLGRGFLYAGAGAIVSSLWRVDDAVTFQLMETLYQTLKAGKSKAAAMRTTQCALLAEQPMLHPAFWGAFQLIGNADPLSTSDKN